MWEWPLNSAALCMKTNLLMFDLTIAETDRERLQNVARVFIYTLAVSQISPPTPVICHPYNSNGIATLTLDYVSGNCCNSILQLFKSHFEMMSYNNRLHERS